jgi:hypothetical protein
MQYVTVFRKPDIKKKSLNINIETNKAIHVVNWPSLVTFKVQKRQKSCQYSLKIKDIVKRILRTYLVDSSAPEMNPLN